MHGDSVHACVTAGHTDHAVYICTNHTHAVQAMQCTYALITRMHDSRLYRPCSVHTDLAYACTTAAVPTTEHLRNRNNIYG